MLIRNKVTYFCAFTALFLLVFDLALLPIRAIGSAPYSFLICFFFLAAKKSNFIRFQVYLYEYRWLLFIYFILTFYALNITVFYGDDVKYLLALFKACLILLTTLSFLAVFSKLNLENLLLIVLFINAVIALVIGSFPEYEYIVYFFKPDGLQTQLIGVIHYRNSFLAGSGYFAVGSVYAVAISFFLAYFVLYKKGSWLKYFMLIVMFTASALAARISIFAVMAMICYLLIIKRRIELIIPIVGCLFLMSYLINTPVFLPAKAWLMQAVNSFYDIDAADSTKVLISSARIFPDNFITILFGDGKYNASDGKYYMNVDIGYLRHWFYGGVFFVFFTLLIPFVLYFKNKNKMFLFALIPIVFLLHFKGVFLLNSPGGMPILIIISHILWQKRKNEMIL